MKDIQTLKKMIYQLSVILDRKQRLKMMAVFFVILVGSLFELLGVSAILPFIQALLSPDDLMQKGYIIFLTKLFHISGSFGVIIMVGSGIVIIYLLKNAYLLFSAYVQASYSNSTQKQLSVLMFRSYLTRPYSFFIETGSGEILRGVNADTVGVYNVITNGFKLISEGLVVAAVAIYLMMIDTWMALGILFVGCICMLVIVLVLKKKIASYARIYQKTSSSKNRWLVQAISGIKDIKVFDRADHFINGYDIESSKYAESNKKYTFVMALPERLIEAFCVSGIIIAVLIRFAVGVNIEAFVTSMAVFAMGAFRILPSIARITGYINGMVYYRPMVEATYNNIVNAREYMDEISSKVKESVEGEKVKFTDKLEIKDLKWKYPAGKEDVLKDFNLSIKKGSAIGIVGESGSGKSTMADLLLRLYFPQNGGIYLDGVDIRTIPSSDWTDILSYVPQNVFLIDDTVRANVIFGRKNVNGDEEVWDALKEASLYDFVKHLPDGLNAIVGERGVKFSGGQRQRIAIARALYSKPQILVLDEATSALDNDTENAVMEAIDALSGNITLIIIAHRVSTLKACDKIYEITEGKAIERDKEAVVIAGSGINK